MKKRISIAVALIAVMTMGSAQAQYSETNNLFYHTFRTPQSTDLNAAFFPNKTTFYLRLPGVGLQFGSPVAIEDVVYNQGDSLTVIDVNRMIDALGRDNNIHFDADINLFGFGFKTGNIYVNFNSRIVANVNANIPGALLDAVRQGNTDATGNAISTVNILNGDIFNTTSYVELALGGAYHIEPINLTVGARAKYLLGLANVQTDNTSAVLTTNSGFNGIRADIYYEFLSAGVADIDSTGKVNVNANEIFSGNSGVAFDLGARYDMGPFSFSFGINDLSAGIHWNKNVKSIHPKDNHIVLNFNGQDATTLLHGGTLNSDSLNSIYQNLINGIRPASSASSDYWYSIPTKINLGANYNFLNKFRAGILFHGQLDRGLLSKKNVREINIAEVSNTFRFNTTLSFGVNLFNWAEFIVGSSVVYDGNKIDALNPGVGVILTPGTVLQIYLMGDYMSSLYLVKAKDFNVKVGVNLLIGNGGSTRIAQN